jgi:hypothetical protein
MVVRDLTVPSVDTTKILVSVVPDVTVNLSGLRMSMLPVGSPCRTIIGPSTVESNRTAPLEDTDRVTFESFEPLN